MDRNLQWQLFNLDSLLNGIKEQNPGAPMPDGPTVDLWVAALAFKNFDLYVKRLPYLVECVTSQIGIWHRLEAVAPEKFWVQDDRVGVLVFPQTEHCGCIRTYRYRGPLLKSDGGEGWVNLRRIESLYSRLETVEADQVFQSWHAHISEETEAETALANGRFENTSVSHSLILSGGGSCLVCAARAVTSARTTLEGGAKIGVLIQLPLCDTHVKAAQEKPSLLAFLKSLLSLSVGLPDTIRSKSIPDELIPQLHTFVAQELGGEVGRIEKRENGWLLRITLPDDWYWLLRLNSLLDYSYMLYRPGQSKAEFRADSAPDHLDLPHFPDHEHSRPNRKSDVVSPSFLYGYPLFDLKRLRAVSVERRSAQ